MADPLRPVAATPVNPAAPADQSLLNEIQSEVSGEAAPLLTFMVNNMKLIVGAILLLLALTLGYGVWQWQEAKSLREARIALGRLLVQEDGQARIKSLQGFLNTAPAEMRSAVLLELASSAVAAGEYATASATFGELAKAEPASSLGMIAVFNQSDLLLRENKPKEALAVLEPLLTSAPEALRGLVRQQMAATAELAGDAQKALSLYEELLVPVPGAGPRPDTETAFFRSRIQALKDRRAAQ